MTYRKNKTYHKIAFPAINVVLNVETFGNLLDSLIELREEFNDFSIVLAEIVTKNISYEIIKKLSLPGFEAVQIGYESPSDNLFKENKFNIKQLPFYQMGFRTENTPKWHEYFTQFN